MPNFVLVEADPPDPDFLLPDEPVFGSVGFLTTEVEPDASLLGFFTTLVDEPVASLLGFLTTADEPDESPVAFLVFVVDVVPVDSGFLMNILSILCCEPHASNLYPQHLVRNREGHSGRLTFRLVAENGGAHSALIYIPSALLRMTLDSLYIAHFCC